MADRHVIIKNGCKEIAWQKGKAVTFLAKWHYTRRLLLPHPPVALECSTASRLFFDKDAEHGMSETMRTTLRRPARSCRRDHLFPGALHQFLQALPRRHLRAHA
jgi:hypothetical protein